MSYDTRDGNNISVVLKSSTDTGEEVVHHNVDTVAIPSSASSIRIAAAGVDTAEEVVVATTPLTQGVTLHAPATNAGDIAVGFGSGITVASGTSVILSPGESMPLVINDLSSVWFAAANSGDIVQALGS